MLAHGFQHTQEHKHTWKCRTHSYAHCPSGLLTQVQALDLLRELGRSIAGKRQAQLAAWRLQQQQQRQGAAGSSSEEGAPQPHAAGSSPSSSSGHERPQLEYLHQLRQQQQLQQELEADRHHHHHAAPSAAVSHPPHTPPTPDHHHGKQEQQPASHQQAQQPRLPLGPRLPFRLGISGPPGAGADCCAGARYTRCMCIVLCRCSLY